MVVSVVAYKRPELLRRCLQSIWRAQRAHVSQIFIQVDWHTPENNREMQLVVSEFNSKLPLIPSYNADRFGVANNTRTAYCRAFADPTIEHLCAVEEDTEVSPDCFELAYEMLRSISYSPYRFVNLCSHQIPRGTDPTKVHEDNELRGGYGWAFTRDFWKYMQPRWNGKNRAPYGWDWHVTHLCYREKWKVLTPEVSRVRHTGREGTYCTPQFFDQHVQHVCDVIPDKYEIVKHELNYSPPDWVQAEMR